MSFSQNMQNSIYTPAAHRPKFQCLQCICLFYNRAGLKNHVRAKHGSQATSSHTSSPVPDHPPSPQHSDSEGEPLHPDNVSFEIHDQEFPGPSPPLFSPDDAPMDVDFEPPFPDDYNEDDDYGYNNDMDLYDHDLHGSDGHSSPPIIPSSPQHESRSHGHQQTPANDKFLRRVYHDKLNGEFLMYFLLFQILNNLCITSRSEM